MSDRDTIHPMCSCGRAITSLPDGNPSPEDTERCATCELLCCPECYTIHQQTVYCERCWKRSSV